MLQKMHRLTAYATKDAQETNGLLCYMCKLIFGFHYKNLASEKGLPNSYNMSIICLAKINPTTQTIAVKVRFSLLIARAKEKSWGEASG